jgi:hypothetical protein
VEQIQTLKTRSAGSRVVAPVRHWVVGIGVRLRAWRLDKQLIAGADPTSRIELAQRAEQLVKLAKRERVALSVDRLVSEFDTRRAQLSAAVPFQRDQIAEARAVLVWLVYELRDAEQVDPRGVAMVDHLIRDVEGPVFAPSPPGELRRRAQEAYECLVGDQPS